MEADAAGLPFTFGLVMLLVLVAPYLFLGFVAFVIFRWWRRLKDSDHDFP